ncbi:MAG: GUN4 domain-containing protein [Cyanobacteria bacterium CAN_BIN43]|nr:GUN4 domain-containing protein [Cyanobacteria bacterium CAN_BIN43]
MNSDNRTDAATNATGAQTREHQERLDRYGQDFLRVLRQESPPGQEMRHGLRQLQQFLTLTDDDVEAIEAKVDQDFQAQSHAYQELLYRYEREYADAIRQEFPLSSASQAQLWQLQDSLGLQRVDVIKIEGQQVAQKAEQLPSVDSLPPSDLPPSDLPPSDLPPSDLPPSDLPPSDSPIDSQITAPPILDPQDFRLPDPLEAKLVDDIDLEPFTTSLPFSRFAEEPTTYLPFSGFAESAPPGFVVSTPVVQQIPTTQLDPPNLRSDWNIDYTHLQELLEDNQWKKADEETLSVMLQATERTQAGWLDAIAIAKFPCTDLHTIDRLWSRYSDEKFSFRVQYRLYSGVTISTENAVNLSRSDEERALELCKNVGWWVKRLEFLRYYNQFDFTLQAPDGHLPALWFWTIPWTEALQYGGIGSGRGGCRLDHRILTAFIDRLEQCGFN